MKKWVEQTFECPWD